MMRAYVLVYKYSGARMRSVTLFGYVGEFVERFEIRVDEVVRYSRALSVLE